MKLLINLLKLNMNNYDKINHKQYDINHGINVCNTNGRTLLSRY